MADPVEVAERMFAEALRRACRQPQGRAVLLLHLSRMTPPAPRPHHRRIARAILQDAAERHEGQVFALQNGDLALLSRTEGLTSCLDRRGAVLEERRIATPDLTGMTLPDILARLLRVDAPDPSHLLSVWPLERAVEPLLRYVKAMLNTMGAPAPPAEEASWPPISDAHALVELISSGHIRDVMQRQTAVAFAHGAAQSASGAKSAVRPIYSEVSFSIPALEARIGRGRQASADPFLFRHLAGRLDQRMLGVLRSEFGSGGPLDLSAGRTGDAIGPPLHLNLTLAGVMSQDFQNLATDCRAAGVTLGIEISMIEACADIAAYRAARSAVREAEMTVVLDGVTHLAVQHASPAALEPDLLKLDWSPRMTDLPEADDAALRTALVEVGPHRIILHRGETEAAIRWGLVRGIRRFQGRHIDAMLGASRIMACPRAPGCTLRQCVERASATGAAGRAGCGNLALLDNAAPTPGPIFAKQPSPRLDGAARRHVPLVASL